MRRFFVLLVLLLAWPLAAADIGSYSRMTLTPPGTDNGEILIDFKNEEAPSAITTFLSKLGIGKSSYSWFSTEERWMRMHDVSSDLLDRIRKSGEVEDIEPNYYLTAFSAPNDPYYKYQWHLDLIGMPQAWEFPAGAPVVVAVIDTGIAKVEDLDAGRFVDAHNFVAGNDNAEDDHGHGTHVAGTIAQLTNNGVGTAGAAPNVKLMPLKVLNSSGYGTLSDVAAAIRYAADHGASVINMSLGGPFPSRILHKAVIYAHDKGVVVVCAAGNSGGKGISYPANYEEAISVSAVRYDRQLTWYSSYGKGLTIAAPGGDLNVDQNEDGLMDGVLQNTLDPQDTSRQGYFLFQGTSMATPHVAAAAALLVSHGVTDPERVREVLQKSATPVKGGSPDEYGAGVLNVDAALKSSYRSHNYKLLLFSAFLLFLFIAFFNKKQSRISKLSWNLWPVLGLLFSATGFFFLGSLPFFHNSFLMTHAIAEWPYRFLGTSGGANPIFFSVLPAFGVALLLFPWKRLAGFSVGFAIGLGAFLIYESLFPLAGIAWIPGRLLEFSWLLMNGLLCIGTATLAAFRVR